MKGSESGRDKVAHAKGFQQFGAVLPPTTIPNKESGILFSKILVADRGEIALRVIRACKELGIDTVAVHSEADANSLHVKFADEDVCIGPAKGEKSYRNITNIISAAEITNADAIHPGYGPLAENSHFAEVCQSCGIKFIGPSPETISKMGDKALAKRFMKKIKVPVIPGSEGPLENLDMAIQEARQIGYPVMLKAVAGGGGRGMRLARDEEELKREWHLVKSEAQAAFSNSDIYLEKYLEMPRHIEIQVLGDESGNVVRFPERECSIQRRHQKLIEESPSVAVNPSLRQKIGDAALSGAQALHYCSAGTIEFLLDREGKFYFIEMNTRIQVEHPVTEMVCGIDIVKEQTKIAQGERLSVEQNDISLSGWAIECRLNAEDPFRNFMPTPGTIQNLNLPGGPGIRVDTHIYAGYKISPYYDSLLAKVIAHGKDRDEAILRMKRCLEETVIDGVTTTLPFHLRVLDNPNFREGKIYVESAISYLSFDSKQ